MIKKTASDHHGVLLTLENQAGELGHERRTIQEGILLDRKVQDEVKNICNKAYTGNRCAANKWKQAMNPISESMRITGELHVVVFARHVLPAMHH